MGISRIRAFCGQPRLRNSLALLLLNKKKAFLLDGLGTTSKRRNPPHVCPDLFPRCLFVSFVGTFLPACFSVSTSTITVTLKTVTGF